MYTIDFNKPLHIHFIGIGGISMSGLAEILLEENFKVTGSDSQSSPMTDKLEQQGAKVYIGQKSSNLEDTIDVVVYTAAIHPDNEEFKAAQDKGLPMLTRAQLLGQIMTNYKQAIAVSGTHGKTTTTSMLSHILLEAKADPTISVGGILDAIDGNIRVGNSDVFVTEACEYTNSFHSFFPTISIILNIEEDHMDFFHDLQEIRQSFTTFANLLPKSGLLVINGDITHVKEIYKSVSCPVVTFGRDESCDYQAYNIEFDDEGHASYDLVHDNKTLARISLHVAGEHNVYNSISAIIVALELGIDLDTIKAGLASFKGTKRRFEYKGMMGDVTIMDDYAHHPTEIKATLESATRYPHRDTWCVFQPHTYTRTKAFLKDFAQALSLADHVVLADIYAAREIDTGEISSRDLLQELQTLHVDTCYFPSFEEIENYLSTNCKPHDLLITMGAGNVVTVGEDLLNK